MKLLRSKRFAVAALILCVAAGTLLSAGRSLSQMKAGVEAAFYEGSESIAGDLSERVIAAGNLAVVAARYLPEDNSAIAAVRDASTRLFMAYGIRDKYLANEDLTLAVNALSVALAGIALSERDATLAKGLPVDLQTRNDYIRRSPYNELAAEYNAVLSGFPAGILATITGVGQAEYFR